MARLLVSVRSATEALEAHLGGAHVIDIKEPLHGPLGQADPAIWLDVRSRIPPSVPISVALGELSESAASPPDHAAWQGISWCKLGLAGTRSHPNWTHHWQHAHRHIPNHVQRVAVVYMDDQASRTPAPESIIASAPTLGCRAILFDTWDKLQHSPWLGNLDRWSKLVTQARQLGLQVALAGRLDLATIPCLSTLNPDLIAVRGAACRQNERAGSIDRARVARLAASAAALPNFNPTQAGVLA